MAEAQKKESIFKRIGRWFREMRSELKKVVWLSRDQVIKNTLIVIGCSIVLAIVVALFDFAGRGIVQGIFTLGGKSAISPLDLLRG